MTEPPRPERSAWVRRMRVVALLLAALVLSVVLALVLIDTSIGHRALLTTLVRTLNQSVLRGQLKVEGLEGSLYRDLSIVGVELKDASGRTALSWERLRVAVDLSALLSGELHLRAIELTGPNVLLVEEKDGSLNLSQLLRPEEVVPPPPSAKRGPSTLKVRLDRAAIEGGAVRFVPQTGVERGIEGLALELKAELLGEDIDATLERLAFDSKEPQMPVLASARLEIKPTSARASFDLSAAEAVLSSDRFELSKDTGAADGQVHFAVPRAFVRRLGLPPELMVEAEVDLRVRPGTGTRPWVWALDGQVAGAPLSSRGEAGPKEGLASLILKQLNPRQIHSQAPGGSLDLEVEARFPRWDRGTVGLDVQGELELLGRHFRVGALTRSTALNGTRASMATEVRVIPREGRGPGSLVLEAGAVLDWGAVPRVETATLALRAEELEAVAGPLLPLRGLIRADLKAKGPLDDLSMQARATVSRLLTPGVRVEGADLAASLTHLPSSAEGSAKLAFSGLRAGDWSFERGQAEVIASEAGKRFGLQLFADGRGFLRRIDVAAGVAQEAEALQVSLGTLSVATSSATWAAKPSLLFLEKGGPITLEPFTLSSAAGVLRAQGRVDPARWTEGTFELELRDLSLGALSGLQPKSLPVSGRVGALLKLRPGTLGPAIDLRADARELRRGRGGPLEGSVQLSLKERQLEAELRLLGPTLGALQLTASGEAPEDFAAVPAWLEARRLKAAELEVSALSLSGLAALTSTASTIAGRLDGRLSLGAGLTAAKGRLSLTELVTLGRRVPADASLRVDAGLERVELAVTATIAGSEPVRVLVHTNVGTRTWLARGVRAVLDAGAELSLRLEHLPAEALAALAGLDRSDPRFDAPRGTLSLNLEAHARPTALALDTHLSVSEFALAKVAPELDVEVDGKVDRGQGDARLTLTIAEHSAAELKAHFVVPEPANLEAWRALDKRALTSIEGTVSRFPLAILPKLGLEVPGLEGEVGAIFGFGPRLESGRIDLAVKGFAVTPHLAPLDVALGLGLRPKEQTVTATISAGQAPLLFARAQLGESLEALAGGGLKAALVKANLSIPGATLASVLRPRPGAELLDGRLELNVAVSGTLASPVAEVRLELNNALVAGQQLGALQAQGTYAKDAAEVEVSWVQRPGATLDLRAKLDPGAAKPDLRAELHATDFDLGFFGPLAQRALGSSLGLHGVLNGQLAARGSLAQPALAGTLRLERLKLVLPGEAPPLEQGTLVLSLSPEVYALNLEGTLGKGAVKLGSAARLNGFEDIQFEGGLTTADVRIAAGDQVVELDSEVEWNGHKKGPNTQLEVVIGDVQVTLPKGRGKRLRPIAALEDVRLVDVLGLEEAQKERAASKKASGSGTLAVTVKTPRPITARGGDNYLEISPRLALELGPVRRQLVGEINIDGRISVLRRRYELQQSKISFPGSFPPDPRLQLRLAHDFDQMTLLVSVGGTASKPDVRFSSQPGGYDQATLLGIFLGAEPPEPGSKSSGQDTARAAASALASQLASKAGEDLPFDTIELDVGGGNRSMSITAGKWLTDDIFLAYQYKFTPPGKPSENQGEGIVRWHFARGWSVETRFGDRGAGSIDAVWLKRF